MYAEQPAGEVLSSHAGDRDLFDPTAPPPPPRSARRSGTIVGASALVVALLAGAGVYVASQSADAGNPASVMPASTFAMVKLDLSPGRAQTTAIERFAKRFPAGEMSTVADVRNKTLEGFAESLDLDYAKDVKPWLGDTAAAAGFLDGKGAPQWVVVLHPKDLPTATRALAAADEPPAVAERDGFLVLSDEQATLDDALARIKDRALSDVPEFAADLERLPGDDVAVAWLDNRRAVDAALYATTTSTDGDEPDEGPVDDFEGQYTKGLQKRARGRVTLGLRAEGDFVELFGISSGDAPKVPVGRPAALRRLRGNTIGAVYVRDLAGYSTTGTGGFALLTDEFAGFGFGLPMRLLAGGRFGSDDPMPDGEFDEPMPAETAVPRPGDGLAPSPECLKAMEEAGELPEACTQHGPGTWSISPDCQKALAAWEAGPDDGAPLPALEACESDGLAIHRSPACVAAMEEFQAALAGDKHAVWPEACGPGGVSRPSASSAPVQPRALAPVLLQDSPEGSDGWDATEETYPGDDPMEAFMWSVLPRLSRKVGPLLDGDVTISLGSLPAPGTRRAPDLALLADVRDDAAAAKAAEEVAAMFAKQFTEQPYAAASGGTLTLASDSAYKDTLTRGNLGETELFQLAMGDLGDEVQLAVLANLERVRDAAPGYPAEMKPLSAVGLSSGVQDGHGYLRLRVVAR